MHRHLKVIIDVPFLAPESADGNVIVHALRA
jgi:hypothetical protein